ncbi:MAG: family 10 glycosylhydrolase [Chloroflexi bacterium]|nr:family 10 glycosylhydrolase [Chloroflexota bacterium]
MTATPSPTLVPFTPTASASATASPTGTASPTETATPSPEPTATAAPSHTPIATTTPTVPPAPLPPRDATRPEYRAFWVDAFHPGIKTPQEVDRLIADMQAANANAVIVQVRRRGDALYNKTFEPRGAELAKLPDYDPLAYLIQKAHAATPPIEVHAWLVAMPVAKRTDLPTASEHLYHKHGPDAAGDEMWLSQAADSSFVAEENYFLDSGHPAAAQYVVDVVLNVIHNYDVDGVHLDYIRYGGQQFGYNPVNLRRYAAASGATATPAAADPAWQQWRRDQVTALMRQIYLEAIALKPGIKISAATIAWGAGPTSDADWLKSGAMADTFQDWLGWLAEGILDIAMPMNYDREANVNQKAWFDRWTAWEKDHRADRHLVVGIGAWLNDTEGNLAQAQRALAPSAAGNTVQGVAFYAYADLDAHGLSPEKFFQALTTADPPAQPFFPNQVRPPAMPWKTQPATGYLKGFVRGDKGAPADGLTVALSGSVTRTLTVAGTGFYGAAGLPPGEYTLYVARAGQAPVSVTATVAAGAVTTADVSVAAGTAETNDKEYLYRIQPTRHTMLTDGPTPEEAELVSQHFAYLEGLTQQGVVVLAGRTPTTNTSSFGIVIFRAASDKAARSIMAADPAVRGGVMRARLFPFCIALLNRT